MKIEESNFPKESDSKYLKACIERNYEKVAGSPAYVQVRYFKTGMQALNWKMARMFGEQNVTGMTTISLENTNMLAMLEWVCRWTDGSISILIVEDNLVRWARGDKEAIEGLSFHVLGHICDMMRRDFLTSFREWQGEASMGNENKAIFDSAIDIALEYEAEKIALEKGGFQFLAKCRGKTSSNFEWLRSDLKQFKKDARAIKKIAIPTRKEYVMGTSLIFLAYRMAWKKSGYGMIYSKLFDASREKIKGLYLEFGIAKKVGPAEVQAEKYCEELESIFDKIDLSDIGVIRNALGGFISKVT